MCWCRPSGTKSNIVCGASVFIKSIRDRDPTRGRIILRMWSTAGSLMNFQQFRPLDIEGFQSEKRTAYILHPTEVVLQGISSVVFGAEVVKCHNGRSQHGHCSQLHAQRSGCDFLPHATAHAAHGHVQHSAAAQTCRHGCQMKQTT